MFYENVLFMSFFVNIASRFTLVKYIIFDNMSKMADKRNNKDSTVWSLCSDIQVTKDIDLNRKVIIIPSPDYKIRFGKGDNMIS